MLRKVYKLKTRAVFLNLKRFPLVLFCLLSLAFFYVTVERSAHALEPPRPGELNELREKGELESRIKRAKEIGNHKFNEHLLTKAIAKAKRTFLQEKGFNQEEIDKQVPLPAPPPAWQGMPTTGNVKMFALLIDFNEYPHFNTQAEIHSKLFGTGNPSDFPLESLASYYDRSSYGLLILNGSTLGWYKPAYDRSSIPQTTEGRENLIKEAIAYFDSQGHDFSQYDNNGDGAIDYFAVFWTGPDNGWANFWWGYYVFQFSDQDYLIDGKSLRAYSWQWESFWDSGAGSGGPFSPMVIIHETGHALGLPDYYDYDGTIGPRGGVGGLDMMAGNWGDHNSLSKWMLDWINPAIVAAGNQAIALNPSGSTPDALVVWPGITADESNTEFFIVQNRYRIGNDSNYPQDGLLVWHVDASHTGSGYIYNNSYTSHKLLRLMEADGLEEIESGMMGANAGDFYTPGKTFNACTHPSSNRYDGSSSSVEVSNISAVSEQITATFNTEHDLSCPRTLTVLKDGDGSGAVYSSGIPRSSFPCDWTYQSDIQVVLTPLASPGSTFIGWTGGDSVSGSQCFVTTNTDKALTATFSYTSSLGSISGTVTGSDGTTPLENIQATAMTWNPSEEFWEWAGSLNTDGDGNYNIGGLLSGAYRLEFRDWSGQYVTEYYNNQASLDAADDIVVVEGQTVTGINASLAVAGRIQGTVYGPDGLTPLENIQVCAYTWDAGGWWRGVGCLYTNSAGNYNIGGLLSGAYRLEFRDWSGQYVTEYYNNQTSIDAADDIVVVEGQTVTGINASLAAAGRIQGTVYGPDGLTPLENIEVYAYTRNAGGWWDWVGGSSTNSAGNYDIGGLSSGTYRVEFYDWSGQYARQYYDNQVSLDAGDDIVVGDGQTVTEIDATLAAAGHIQGRVYGPDGLTPLQNIEVVAYSWNTANGWWDWVGGSSTNSAGDYDIGGFSSGTYRLGFHDGSGQYAREYYNNQASLDAADDIVVGEGQTVAGINASLAAASHIQGRVYGPDGLTPLETILVYAYTQNPGGGWNRIGSSTNSAGDYDIGGLSSGTYRVEFYDGSGQHATEYYNNQPNLDAADDIVVGEGQTVSGIDATLAMAGHIQGRVYGPDGLTPLENIEVVAYSWNTASGWWDWVGGSSTNSAGDYDIGRLSSGTYRVGFTDWSGGQYVTEFYDNKASLDAGDDIVVGEGQMVTGIDATLAAAGRIQGTVYESDGTTPITGKYIRINVIQGNPCGNWSWITDVAINQDDGTYGINGLSAGDYFLHTWTPENYFREWWAAPHSVRDCADAQAISVQDGEEVTGRNFQLDPGASISGTVYQSDGITPLTGDCMYIGLYATDDPCDMEPDVLYNSTNVNGEYYFGGLLPGTYYVRTMAEGDGMFCMGFDVLNEWWAAPASVRQCDDAQAIVVSGTEVISGIDFQLENGAGDVNNDQKVNLADGIVALQILTGITPSSSVIQEADINGDGKIGMEEVIYILETVAGVR
jgi:M6 family metalloprotease-like protein